MTNIEIYEMLQNLLSQKTASMCITAQELERYYIPEGIVLNQTYLERLASSLQNSGMMHNSIRFNESQERYEHIKAVLYDFDCHRALAEYPNWRSLYDALTRHGEMDKGVNRDSEDKRTNWGKYAKGLYDGMEFLTREKGSDQIRALCQQPQSPAELKQNIRELKRIEDRIHGLGFALTCDWLKECGCTWLAKPDIHIKIVCSAMAGLGEEKELSDVDTVKFVFQLSEAVRHRYPEATAYRIDKMIWLICTGNFYLQKDKIGRDTILALLK